MFFGGLRSFVSGIGQSNEKVMASSNFLENIKTSKNKAEEKEISNKDNEFNLLLDEGKKLLNDFSKTKNNTSLKSSAENFLNAAKIKPSKLEPHINLAYIFYLYKLKDEANTHLKLAEKINPSHPLVKEIRKLIFSVI